MFYRVNNAEIEGQHPLIRVTPVQFQKSKLFLATLFTFLTGSLFALALKWSNKLYNLFLFTPCQSEAIGTHYRIDTQNGQQFTVPKEYMNGISYFTFRLLKYTFDPQTQCYKPIEFETDGKIINEIITNRNTLTRDLKLQYFGSCQLQIPIQPLYEFLFENLTGPFNILQYFAVAVWFAQGTYIFPILILAFTGIAVIVNYLLYRRSRSLLQKLATIHQNVTLIDGDTHKIVNGSELLPGDYILLKEDMQLNCDCAIIKGDVMVNEATLTGENVPIPKTYLPDINNLFNFEILNQHCLFEGTKLVKVNITTDNIAIVLRTGFSSLRGQYFRNVLFPQSPSKRFYIQAAKFILTFAIIVGVVYAFMLIKYIPMNFQASLLVLRFLDNIVWSIPPSMPIFFNICKTASLVRLSSIGINGSNADKIEQAGKIDTCCFDKTGTLTTLGLQAQLYWAYEDNLKIIAEYILACCHHLLLIDNQLQGDPLEVEMFNFIKWNIDFKDKAFFTVSQGEKSFEIIKIFDFSSARQMMSVIAFDGESYYLFSKGSPEMIYHNSIEKQQCVLDEVKKYASNGLRVLGLGYRKLTTNQLNEQREQIENQLNIVGIFVLENPLKNDTTQVINTLKNSGLDIKVISGDSPITTIYCAKTAGIIQVNLQTVIIDYVNKQLIIQDGELQKGFHDPNQHQQILEEILNSDKQTAITGKFLEYMSQYLNQNEKDTANLTITNNSTNQILTENNLLEIDDEKMKNLTYKIISKTKVFARQKPDQKKQIVQLLQQMGRQVMMTGDGANDCSAIAQAQVGISFSESDASYTAPFSSKSTSIQCCVQVLAQGKAAIMTIIEVFQYQLSVNGIKFAGVTIMFLEAQNFSEFQTVYVGFISNIPLLIFLCISAPAQELASYIPLDDQFTYQNQIQIYTNIFFAVLGLCINYGILSSIDRFIIYTQPITSFTREGILNSIIFMSLMYYFMSMSISIYISKPFKLRYYQNILLTFWTTLGFVIALVTFIFPTTGKWCGVIDITQDTYDGFNWIILSVVIGTSFLGFFFQTILQKIIPSMYKIK